MVLVGDEPSAQEKKAASTVVIQDVAAHAVNREILSDTAIPRRSSDP